MARVKITTPQLRTALAEAERGRAGEVEFEHTNRETIIMAHFSRWPSSALGTATWSVIIAEGGALSRETQP